MKKYSQSGFVLAETLVVAVFLMTIFGMIYYYFYPLMGEYEKREVYDSVDDKYSVYWLKRLIEDSAYQIPDGKRNNFKNMGYVRFECSDMGGDDDKRLLCKTLVKSLQVEGCNKNGDLCSIFITKYCIGDPNTCEVKTTPPDIKSFKKTVKESTGRHKYDENCTSNCENKYVERCAPESTNDIEKAACKEDGAKPLFKSGFQDYVETLPDYKIASLNGSKYRVIAVFQHTADNNNYYSYATIEVK